MPARQTPAAGISASLRKDHKTASEYPPEGGDEIPIEKRIGNRKTASEYPPEGGDEVPIEKRIGNRKTARPQRYKPSLTRTRNKSFCPSSEKNRFA